MVGDLRDAAAGCDCIPVKVVKQIVHEIKAPLTFIFNLSFVTGKFPDKLKQSRVTPLYKADEKSNLNNYRPVSVLPVFSKILEKIMYNRLNHFVNTNNIISHSQHG